MTNSIPKKKKWIAIGIVSAMATAFGSLMQFFSDRTLEYLVEQKNLGEILAQIEEANVDTRTLSSVLRNPHH